MINNFNDSCPEYEEIFMVSYFFKWNVCFKLPWLYLLWMDIQAMHTLFLFYVLRK